MSFLKTNLLTFSLFLTHLQLGLFSSQALAGEPKEMRVQVLVSTELLADLARQLLPEESFEVSSLIGFDEDPHSYELKPQDLRRWKEFDYFLYWGHGIEPWVKNYFKQKNFDSKSLQVTKNLKLLRLNEKNKSHSHSHEDHKHENFDPHIWHDPLLIIKMLEQVQTFFSTHFPDQSTALKSRNAKLKNELEKIHKFYKEKIDKVPVKARKIVTTHDAFAYLGRSFGIEFHSALGWASNTEPSAKWIAQLVNKIRSEKIGCFLGEHQLPSKLVSMLAKESGLNTNGELLADNLSKKKTPQYQDFIRYNLDRILHCLDPLKNRLNQN